MQNLARSKDCDEQTRKDCDDQVRLELLAANINVVEHEPNQSEVPTIFHGELHGWTFYRAWYYWIATPTDSMNGLPLDIAEQLHEKYGQEVRVAGHCACPPPVEWAAHFTPDGKQVVVDPDGEEEAQFVRFLDKGLFGEEVLDKHMFVTDLNDVEHISVITSYHIDTLDGLLAFTETLDNWKSND